jgi:hypothetical protein
LRPSWAPEGAARQPRSAARFECRHRSSSQYSAHCLLGTYEPQSARSHLCRQLAPLGLGWICLDGARASSSWLELAQLGLTQCARRGGTVIADDRFFTMERVVRTSVYVTLRRRRPAVGKRRTIDALPRHTSRSPATLSALPDLHWHAAASDPVLCHRATRCSRIGAMSVESEVGPRRDVFARTEGGSACRARSAGRLDVQDLCRQPRLQGEGRATPRALRGARPHRGSRDPHGSEDEQAEGLRNRDDSRPGDRARSDQGDAGQASHGPCLGRQRSHQEEEVRHAPHQGAGHS